MIKGYFDDDVFGIFFPASWAFSQVETWCLDRQAPWDQIDLIQIDNRWYALFTPFPD